MVSLLLAGRLQRKECILSYQWASFEVREGALMSAGVFTGLRVVLADFSRPQSALSALWAGLACVHLCASMCAEAQVNMLSGSCDMI